MEMTLPCKNRCGEVLRQTCVVQNKAKDALKGGQLLAATRQKEAPQSRACTYPFEVRIAGVSGHAC